MITFLAALHQAASDALNPRQLASGIERLLAIILLAIAAWVTLRLSLSVIRRGAARIPQPTMTPILEGLARYVIVLVAAIMMLDVVHVNVAPLLASAGVAGLALGFGAQFLIRDLLSGFFLLSEGVIQIGDTVRVNGDIGTVERITLRVTQLRKFNGELLTIPNGAITKIGNLSRDFGRAIVQVTVSYRSDLEAALGALQAAAGEWAASHPGDVIGEPTVDGAVDLNERGVVLQTSVRVGPGRQGDVEADLRRRILEALAARRIEIDTRISATL
jgi:moderate conductance mechanosensitive channel